jgi:hypothetical protein
MNDSDFRAMIARLMSNRFSMGDIEEIDRLHEIEAADQDEKDVVRMPPLRSWDTITIPRAEHRRLVNAAATADELLALVEKQTAHMAEMCARHCQNCAAWTRIGGRSGVCAVLSTTTPPKFACIEWEKREETV